ncbi:Para-hydroxybenzoate--polyprenyltransferase, mitochondrial precursor (PHB:polyprenyltransferase) [Xylographa bjoerkii]|nr:Para-hydroxybenzoate--polyprenyltransferase, mitochondrial precursor (PHB:polyprenyltransferase) [Xylographa bjoerkii]
MLNIVAKPTASFYLKLTEPRFLIRRKAYTLAQIRFFPTGEPCFQRPLRSNRTHILSLASTGSAFASLSTASKAVIPETKASYPQQRRVSLVYEPPKTGLVASLPKTWIPYAELVRLDKPTGTYYLFFPCLFSTLMAATYSGASAPVVFSTTLLFFTGALVMRGAGCTVNDLWDRNLDPHVARTRLRPIARGAVAPSQAVVFTGFQLLAGLAILLQFPTSCLYYGIPSLVLVATYPLAKRITHYPQFVLGLTFSWGALMGFPALGVDIMADSTVAKAACLLYSSCVSWTVLYDMIYAHMDIKDDAKAGIKSIALRHYKETKVVLSGLAVVQIGSLAAAGMVIGTSPVFFIGSCGSAAVTLGIMIWKVKLKDVNNCWWWFKNGAWLTGGGIAAGLLGEYVLQESGNNRKAFEEELL